MPKHERNIIIKVTSDPGTGDPSLTRAMENLAAKVGKPDVYHIDDLPDFSGQDLSRTRIYIHGHGDWMANAYSGRQPADVAQKLVRAKVKDAALISLT